ncbi:phosphoribosylformylglycinamidine synthase subunit PurQ [bacterium]|nr:phosphoribosylformylglycinamidine synthase subunit PurQ [bacterium]
MKAGIVVFPGSNCDRDCLDASERIMGWQTVACWHGDDLPRDLDLVILPGGFSHGDYLRAGALAALAPVMEGVRRHVDEGRHVIGICNGFQILCESGLLPGALLINRGLVFRCEDVDLKVERRDTAFTSACPDRIRMPIAHREGRYFADAETLVRIEGEGQVLFRYAGKNPNGSLNDIAGIMNDRGNVCGLMPHPERACEAILGGTEGRSVFESLANIQEVSTTC